MSFFGIGSLEIIIILVVAFLVLGPTRLVGVARGLGKIVRELRSATSQITRIMEEEDQERPPKEKDPGEGQ